MWLAVTRVASMPGMLPLVTVALRTGVAHAAIESHAGVVPRVGQPESRVVAPSAPTTSCVAAVFDAPAE